MIRRWWLIAGAILAALFVAFVYLTVATPRYDVTAVLMAEHAATANPADFLAAQRRAILMPPVQADDIAGFYPEVELDPTEATLTVTVETDKPREAVKALSAMLDRYLKNAAHSPAAVAQKLTDLAATREKLAADRDAKAKALAELKSHSSGGSDVAAVAGARREQLAAAVADAEKQLAAAKSQADAAASFPTDPLQQAPIVTAARAKGAFKELDQQLAIAKARLDEAETKLSAQNQTLLSQHPSLLATQKLVEQLKTQQATLEAQYPQAYRDWAAVQVTTAQKKLTELQGLLAHAAPPKQATTGAAEKIAELETASKEADAAVAAIDKQIREATVSSDAAFTVKLVQPPTAPDKPSHPRRQKVFLIAAAIGLLVGLALAAAGRR